eukprot:2209871-Amphidinium_carterae.1
MACFGWLPCVRKACHLDSSERFFYISEVWACLEDVGALEQCGFSVDMSTLKAGESDSAQVIAEDALALQMWRLVMSLVARRSRTCMDYSASYPWCDSRSLVVCKWVCGE